MLLNILRGAAAGALVLLLSENAAIIEPVALERLMAWRDRLLARDVGQWLFNSGLMGFRRTERNHEMLLRLMEKITLLADKSDVYASDGDQRQFIEALEASWQAQDKDIGDFISFNTPWIFGRPDSFTVHYYGVWPELRALMMAHDAACQTSASFTRMDS